MDLISAGAIKPLTEQAFLLENQTIGHQFAGFGHMFPYGRAHKFFSTELKDFLCPFVDEGNQTVFIGGNKTVMAKLKDLVIIHIVYEHLFTRGT